MGYEARLAENYADVRDRLRSPRSDDTAMLKARIERLERIVDRLTGSARREPDLEAILERIAARAGISPPALRGRMYRIRWAKPRGEFCYIALRDTSKTPSEVGRFFGGRDRSTIIKCAEKYADALYEGRE